MITYRAHPLTILGNLWRVLYLVIIPVLRGLFLALQDDIASWVKGAWADILIFLVMIGIAALRWWKVGFWWEGSCLHIQKGLFLAVHSIIPREKIVTVSRTESFYLRPFRAVRLRMDTIGGSARDADFTMLLSPQTAAALHRAFTKGDPPPASYTPRTKSIVALSLLNTNSLAGVIFIATFISQSGRLLGEEFSGRLLGTFEEVTRTLAFGIPPAAAAIAYVLLGGWVVGFLQGFFRYKNVTVARNGAMLEIAGGIATRRIYSVRYSDIVYLDIRQSLTTRLLGLYSLYISAVGYAKRKEDIACLIPTERAASFAKNRAELFPEASPAPRQLYSDQKGILRYIADPLWPILGIPAVTALTLWQLENWGTFILFCGGMALGPSIFFLVIRITDYCTGGAARQGDIFTLRYSKGLYLHTVVVAREKIVQVEFRRKPSQWRKGTCDVLVDTRSELKTRHRLRNLDMEKALKMFASASGK